MAPHLTFIAQDKLIEWGQKFTPIQVHQKLQAFRARRNIQCPDLTAVRKFLKGKAHRRGAVETRGAKRKWTRAHVLTANRMRRQKIKACKGTSATFDCPSDWSDVECAVPSSKLVLN